MEIGVINFRRRSAITGKGGIMGLTLMEFKGVSVFVTHSPDGIEHVETECGRYDLTEMIRGDVYDDLLRIVVKKEAEEAESDFYNMVRG